MKTSNAVKKTRQRKRNRRRSHWWVPVVGVALFVSFCYSAYRLADGLLRAKQEQDAFKDLSAMVVKTASAADAPSTQGSSAPKNSDAAEAAHTASDEPSDPAPASLPVERTPLPQYVPLYEMNPDFFGWLSIEGTDIDYPVMYTPDRPDYYLERAFDGSFSYSGVPFIDEKCPADGNFYLIYGHHMQNKTMFGHIPKYADQSYYEEHPIIRFDTLYEQREYQVIAAFYSRVYGKNETDVFRYYEYTDLTDEAVFNKYIQQVQAAAIYDTGFGAEYGDELLALSTCNYHTADGRFVVIAKRV